MTPFLQQVATTYFVNEKASLADFCFVFPNKRSGSFFEHYLTLRAEGQPFIMPEIATISDVTHSFSSLTDAPRLDQLFILYNEYRRLSDDIADFDRFLFWGEMLLNDFNDVDLSLADPHKLFVNLKRFREVNANYLTPEQIEIINRYWGETFAYTDPDEFWRHLHDTPTELESKFLKLWEVLDPLFENFKHALLERGMATRGMFARNAVDCLSALSDESSLPYRRYIFVGFNVLTLAEIKIFELLKKRGCADFYWDMASPVFKDEGNRATLFMKRNEKLFPSLYDLSTLFPEELSFPKIHITGVPGSFAQTKAAGRQLATWIADGIIENPANAIDTAVVLPDESLFIPMIHAVPEEISELNITMGFPLKSSSVASLITSIVNMQLRSMFSKDEWSFFYEDLRSVLTHPLIRALAPEQTAALLSMISERRLYMISAAKIAEVAPDIAYIFTPVRDTDNIDEVYGYFFEILSSMSAFTSADEEMNIDNYVVTSYLTELTTLYRVCSREGVELKDSTFMQLLQNTMASASIRFTGEPLAGMQLMGVLETRALDFDNLVMLSMNERIFPRKHYSRSFIPDTLRRSYGMSTVEFQESIFAYSFYRLISRAKNVRLFYDGRSVGTKSSEISRYVLQLVYLFPECEVVHDIAVFPSESREEECIVIDKTPAIMEKLRAFTQPGGPSLSASTINDYINCPLSFYLKRICRLDLDEEVVDYMDSATYGSILHEAAETIYKDLRGDRDEVKVTAETLDAIIGDSLYIDKVITSLINERFNRLPHGDLTPLVGESKVMAKVMKHFLVMMFREEKKIAPFDYIDAEHKIVSTMKINDTLTVNIKQFIDRIDRVYPGARYGEGLGVTRIVDYKTGSDSTDFKDIDELFDSSLSHRRKALLQLLFYCNAYAREIGSDEPIIPLIYSFRTLAIRGISPVEYNGEVLDDYRKVNDEFLPRFKEKVAEIFDEDVPFTQALNEENCLYCSFKSVCRKS